MRIISPANDGYHYFFGYYDLQPLDSSGRMHLAHRVGFMDRLPEAGDVAELGAIDLDSGEFVKYADTTAWNFQQGAMLRRIFDDRHIIYNVRDDSFPSGFGAEIRDIATGETRRLPAPIADLSRDGSHALSVNFSRIFDFRPGYGYAGRPDPFRDVNAPETDGVFLMDVASGSVELIADYARIRREFPQPPYSDGKLMVNHITFNPSGTKFLFLLRNFPLPGENGWKTQLIVSDLEGNMRLITDYCLNSHYYWKNDREILIFSSGGFGEKTNGLWLMDAENGERTLLSGDNPTFDIHCIYSPDGRYIIGDSYPSTSAARDFTPKEAGATRSLWLIDTATGRMTEPVRVKTVIPSIIDIRCDLHVRWSPDGSFVTFDSTHTGQRTIVRVDAAELGI